MGCFLALPPQQRPRPVTHKKSGLLGADRWKWRHMRATSNNRKAVLQLVHTGLARHQKGGFGGNLQTGIALGLYMNGHGV